MAWTSAHFAMGMACGGGAVAVVGLWRPGLWRWMTPAMTLAGVWATAPDLPRLWREYFPSLPMSGMLGRRDLEASLHGVGDLFFFHAALDAQPREFALQGFFVIVALYNAAFVLQMLRRRGGPRHRGVADHVPRRSVRSARATASRPPGLFHEYATDLTHDSGHERQSER
jgi:hypothetical protein